MDLGLKVTGAKVYYRAVGEITSAEDIWVLVSHTPPDASGARTCPLTPPVARAQAPSRTSTTARCRWRLVVARTIADTLEDLDLRYPLAEEA